MSELASHLRTKITGVCPAAQSYAIAQLLATRPAAVWLVLLEEMPLAAALAEDIALFHRARSGAAALEIQFFPEAQPDSRDLREAFHAAGDRLGVLSRLHSVRTVSGSQLSEGVQKGRDGAPSRPFDGQNTGQYRGRLGEPSLPSRGFLAAL